MNPDSIIVIIGGVLILIGLVGCVIPVLPGPLIAWAALPLLWLTTEGVADYDQTWFIVLTVLMVVVTILDLLLPVLGTKLFGGTKSGKIGSLIGVVAGIMLLGPFGLILGPFLGAMFGELSANKDMDFAVKSGIGSVIGFLIGTLSKVVVVSIIAYQYYLWVF